MFLFGIVFAEAQVKDSDWVEEYIVRVAMAEGVSANLAWNIANSESGFDPNAENPHSTASGAFQYLDGTFKSYCINKYKLTDTMADKNNPIIQVNCAIYMLKEKDGWKHWQASKHVWGKNVIM